MPGRKYEVQSGYRYGFNGKEKDKDIGNGAQDYGFRVYDTRIGKFLSIDPLAKKYSELTPYQFASNRTIQGIDLDGKEVLLVTGSANMFFIIAGGEIGCGIAFGKEGVALVAFQTVKLGGGLEFGASLNGTLYPSMENLKDLGGLSMGIGISGKFFFGGSAGVNKSSGHWGATGGVGPGVGGHASFDFSVSGLRIIKWADLVNIIKYSTELEIIALKEITGINDQNVNNSIQIIQDYFSRSANELKVGRINKLKSEISEKQKNISLNKEFLEDYKKSGLLYRLANYLNNIETEASIKEDEKNVKKLTEELNILQNTHTTSFEGGSMGGGGSTGRY